MAELIKFLKMEQMARVAVPNTEARDTLIEAGVRDEQILILESAPELKVIRCGRD